MFQYRRDDGREVGIERFLQWMLVVETETATAGCGSADVFHGGNNRVPHYRKTRQCGKKKENSFLSFFLFFFLLNFLLDIKQSHTQHNTVSFTSTWAHRFKKESHGR